jgi:hypothetical protein
MSHILDAGDSEIPPKSRTGLIDGQRGWKIVKQVRMAGKATALNEDQLWGILWGHKMDYSLVKWKVKSAMY